MKIVKKNNRKVEFKFLGVGEVFLYKDECYIKINMISCDDYNCFNAAKLSNGLPEKFLPDFLVEKVNGYFELVEEAEK